MEGVGYRNDPWQDRLGCRRLMLLWRLSGRPHAEAFDGGYGLLFDGRWNTVGHAVTYCATSPALYVLEKLVHVEDPAFLPDDWRRQEGLTQQRGDDWHKARVSPLLKVPSAIVPFAGSPDNNLLINHNHPAAAEIKILELQTFVLDPRLF